MEVEVSKLKQELSKAEQESGELKGTVEQKEG